MNPDDLKKIRDNLSSIIKVGQDQLLEYKKSSPKNVKKGVRNGIPFIELGGISVPPPVGIAKLFSNPEMFLVHRNRRAHRR